MDVKKSPSMKIFIEGLLPKATGTRHRNQASEPGIGTRHRNQASEQRQQEPGNRNKATGTRHRNHLYL